MTEFTKIQPDQIDDNVFKLVGKDWMLVAAGSPENFNMMTASWGGMGVLWNKNICWCVIRPQRHTYGYFEDNDIFSLSFFEEKYRPILKQCGTVSGRDFDKMGKSGLTLRPDPKGGIVFEESRLAITCRKIYHQDLDPKNFLDEAIHKEYPEKDYHRMYVGEIIDCLKR
jgi:flavin reductase (DIM6/NTAB) family NADH-FMN oxidoreductase RutF